MVTNMYIAPTHVAVLVAARCWTSGTGYSVGFELMRVHLDLEFLRGAAPAVDGCDARNGQQSARHDPILSRAQIRDSEMLRADDLITIDFAGRAVSLDVR